MRRIIYLKPAVQKVLDAVLDECSLHTPLVEPHEDGVFCDLSGCGPVENIIKAIARRNYQETAQQARMSLASSRLLAENALKRSRLSEEKLYRCFKSKEIMFIEVLPGREEEFTASIPIEEFTEFTAKEAKKLKRAGFTTTGEIGQVAVTRLISMLGSRGHLLASKCRGIDDTPILGLYPELEISYPLIFAEGNFDLIYSAAQIKRACRVMQTILEKRDSGCGLVCLELKVGGTQLKREHRLKSGDCRAEILSAAIMGMLEKAELKTTPEEGRIVLNEISTLDWQEQDIFSLLPCEKNSGGLRVGKMMETIETRFPGKVMFGLKEARREKILAYFDPWRLV